MSPYNAAWPLAIALLVAVVSLGLIVKVVGDLRRLREQFSLGEFHRDLYQRQKQVEDEFELLSDRIRNQTQQSFHELRQHAAELSRSLEDAQAEGGLHSKVVELEKIIERNSASLDKAVKAHALTNQLQNQLKELMKSAGEHRDKAEEAITALDARTETVTSRLQQMETLLQQTRTEIVEVGNALKANGEINRTSGKSLEKTVKSSADKVATIQRQLEESTRVFQKMADYGQSLESVVTRVSELEERLIEMSGGLEHALETVSAMQPEPAANSSRIIEQNGASLSTPETVESIASGNGGQRRTPRIISPEGRAQYQTVLEMSAAGNTPSEIATSINLDEAEVELILAGESSSASA